jgi:hypothetical protein
LPLREPQMRELLARSAPLNPIEMLGTPLRVM